MIASTKGGRQVVVRRYILIFCCFFSCTLLISQEVDTVNNKKSSFAVFPVFSYAPETDVQLGAIAIWSLKSDHGVQGSYNRQSTITPYFIYTFKQQSVAKVNVDYYFPNGKNLNMSVRYSNFPDSYFGIGNENNPDISEKYTNRFFQLDGILLHLLNEKVFVGGAFDVHFTTIRDVKHGGMLALDQPIGKEGGNVFSVGPAFRYDTRDYTIYPTQGYFIAAKTLVNALGDFRYTSFEADFRKYLHIKNEDNVVAFQFRTQLTFGVSPPFYKLPQLGGDERLRGIANASLYRDRHLIYGQVEYRRPLFWRFGFTVFAGLGQVANRMGDFSASAIKYIVGMGGRFAAIPKKKLNARLDIGLGPDGQTGIYVGISEAF